MPADEEYESPENQSISVDIYDQIYRLRGTDPAYIEQLATLVDGKMRAVSAQGGTVDSLRVAVLYNLLAGSLRQSQPTVRSRSASLSGMLDEVFDEYEEPIARAS